MEENINVSELARILDHVWSSVLGLQLKQKHEKPDKIRYDHMISGLISYKGSTKGALIMNCPLKLAKQVAAIMFETDETNLDISETIDAIGEIVNVMAGNVRKLFDESCYLSLPEVAEGYDYHHSLPRSKVITSVSFECECQPVTVTLLKECVN
jgi:CheY-specific phosphatase CheX